MLAAPMSTTAPLSRTRSRTALVASVDVNFRQRLSEILTGLRWEVREAGGGAQIWEEAEARLPEAIIVDAWLPDLDLGEFLRDFRASFPDVDLVTASGTISQESPRGPYRQELLYALRRSQDTDTAAWNTAPSQIRSTTETIRVKSNPWPISDPIPAAVDLPESWGAEPAPEPARSKLSTSSNVEAECLVRRGAPVTHERLPELIGNAPCMLEVSRRIRLVASRTTPVLIEGPTGSGKELVAEALHRLSPRNRKPFVCINCAAIPEALLEAELFGHTRGAFTGAVHGRVGRIESADGGTLFLDEIGEMPLALQSKLLRFVECGELQRVGDNETVKVDVRIVAATHRPLAQHTQTGGFRADLYYRLAVFLIRTPSLAEHAEDLHLLVDHFMEKLSHDEPIKSVDGGAMIKLESHSWPGNVRELEHVLERGTILAADASVLTADEIDFGFSTN
jgi:DNA-binding NtrC family response regulator